MGVVFFVGCPVEAGVAGTWVETIVATLIFEKRIEMEKSEASGEKPVSNDAIYADENVQKFLALLAEIIVDLTLKEYEYQARNRVPPDQSGAAE